MSAGTFVKVWWARPAFWFRVRGWGLTIGRGEPLPSSRYRHGNWHHVGPVWFRALRPADMPGNDGQEERNEEKLNKQVVVREGEIEIDVTVEVGAVYDLLMRSMDYGSGFLSIEDITLMARLALAAGYVMPEEAEAQMAAYMRMSSPVCPTCGLEASAWENVSITSDKRIVKARPCGHWFELSTMPGEPAGLRPLENKESRSDYMRIGTWVNDLDDAQAIIDGLQGP